MSSNTQRKIEVFGTSIMSSNKVRSNHDLVNRILTQAKLVYDFHDIAGSETLKLRYRKILASNHITTQELPLVLSGGEVVGTVAQLEEAVEFGELRQYLLLDVPVAKSPDDELLGQLSAAELKELSADLNVSAHPAAQKVADEVQQLTGSGRVEKPVEPAPTPAKLGQSPTSAVVYQKSDDLTKSKPQNDVLSNQLLVGKDEVEMKRLHELEKKHDGEKEVAGAENDVPSLAAASSSIGSKIQEKIDANPEPAALEQ